MKIQELYLPINVFNDIREKWKHDPVVYQSILNKITKVLHLYGVRFYLGFGTLLGAIRDKHFIDNDTDIDLVILECDEERLVEAIQSDAFLASGLTLIRTHQEYLLSVSEQDQYCDLYVFRPKDLNYQCWKYTIEKERLDYPQAINFLGTEYLIPKDPETYLDRVYGNWHIPAQDHAREI